MEWRCVPICRSCRRNYLQTQQRAIEIKATRKGLTDALSVFINQPISENTQLEMPADYNATDTTIMRPELQLYQSQSLLLGRAGAAY